MKTPREILFQRHQSAERKLDLIRHETLAMLAPTEAPCALEPEQAARSAPASWSAPVLWRFGFLRRLRQPRRHRIMESARGLAHSKTWRLLHSLRWHLAALSAAWLAIVLLNIDHAAAPLTVTAKQSIPAPRQLLLALRENRRQLLMLLEPPVTEPAARPPRRSQLSSTTAFA